MKLFLLRHAKTEQTSPSGKDFDRKLKPKGLKQCELLGQYFSELSKEMVFTIHCSSSQRTRETFELIKRDLSVNKINFYDELYHASVFELKNFVEKLPVSPNNHLIIGHNFGISELASYYTGEIVELSTGALAIIDFTMDEPGLLTKNSGSLELLFEPNNLIF